MTEVDGDRVVGVDTLGLAELIAATGFPRVDLLKIDTEGSEYEVFRRDRARYPDGVEMIFVECHPVPGRSPSELIGRLQSLGFDVAAEAFVHQSFLGRGKASVRITETDHPRPPTPGRRLNRFRAAIAAERAGGRGHSGSGSPER